MNPKISTLRVSVYVLFLLGLTIPVISITALGLSGDLYDDAFITYRYSSNLANGEGLTWNPGEAPTEGFTSMMHVLLLTPIILLGVDALDAARWINLAAFVATVFTLFMLARVSGKNKTAGAATVAAVFAMTPAAISLVMVGLETPIYTLVLLLAVSVSTVTLTRHSSSHWLVSIGVASMWFALMLTRPEGLLLIPAVWLVGLANKLSDKNFSLKLLTQASLLFLLPAFTYVLLKISWFGSAFPNPFFIKSSGLGLSPQGLGSVIGFFDLYSGVIALSLFTLIFLWGRTGLEKKIPANIDVNLIKLIVVLLLIFAIFYLRTDTLTDIYGRFLFPLLPLVILLASPLIVFSAQWSLSSRLIFTPLAFVAIAIAVTVLSGQDHSNIRKGFIPTAYDSAINYAETQRSSNIQLQIAETLSQFPEISNVRIAYGDAGLIPYLTKALWLDPVGLNDSYLARSDSLVDSVNYFFESEPDVVFQPVTKDGSPIDYGHGLLGNYTLWSDDARWQRYEIVGTFERTDAPYDLEIRIQKDGPFANQLTQFLTKKLLSDTQEFNNSSVRTIDQVN